MSNGTYNGWRNRETWLLKLWIDNEYGDYLYWQERTSDRCSKAEAKYEWETDRDAAVRLLEKELEDWVDGQVDERLPGAGFLADLMSGATGRIDFREVAEAMVGDVWEGPSSREGDGDMKDVDNKSEN